MFYDVQFIFPSDMTVGRVNELVDKIGIDLDGSVSTGDFWIDGKGIYIYANFDYANTRPCAVRKWACDHGVIANTRADDRMIEWKSDKVTGGCTMTDLDTLIERIKADRKGTLIVICGRVGCGKTTLALKLMSSINGSDDISFIVTQSDLMRLEGCRGVHDARAHIAEDILNSRSAEGVCGLATMGYIPIVAVTDLCYIPRQYRGPSKEGLSSVLVIQFGGQRGEFKAIYSVLVGGRLSTSETSGTVTQEDVDRVRGIAEKWKNIRYDRQWVYDGYDSRIL